MKIPKEFPCLGSSMPILLIKPLWNKTMGSKPFTYRKHDGLPCKNRWHPYSNFPFSTIGKMISSCAWSPTKI